jgi:hypothetical protein
MRWLRDLVRRDLSLKLLALGLGVAFWLSVASEPVIERRVMAPLGLENVPDDLSLAGDLPESVEVRVRGASSVINGLVPGAVVASVDLADVGPGRFTLPVAVASGPGVDVMRVDPPSVSVTIR